MSMKILNSEEENPEQHEAWYNPPRSATCLSLNFADLMGRSFAFSYLSIDLSNSFLSGRF